MGRGPTEKFYNEMNEFYVSGTLTCLKPEVIKEKINVDFPLVLNIEPTNDCNLKCYFCPREKAATEFGVHYLEWPIYTSIIDQATQAAEKNGQLIMLNLHKDGEPLLHPKLPEMVKYAKDKKAFHTIHLNTNGMLLGTERAKALLEAGIDDITISIDAARPDTFARFKGVDALIKLEENIRQFFRWRDELSADTFIRVKIMEFEDIDTEEVQEFIQRWQDIADQVQVTGTHSWSGAIEGMDVSDEQTQERYPCGLLWYMLAVNADGTVSMCNVDWNRSGVVGNVKQESLREIWNGNAIKKIRSNQLKACWNEPAVCKDCVVWVSVGDMKEYFLQRQEFWR